MLIVQAATQLIEVVGCSFLQARTSLPVAHVGGLSQSPCYNPALGISLVISCWLILVFLLLDFSVEMTVRAAKIHRGSNHSYDIWGSPQPFCHGSRGIHECCSPNWFSCYCHGNWYIMAVTQKWRDDLINDMPAVSTTSSLCISWIS